MDETGAGDNSDIEQAYQAAESRIPGTEAADGVDSGPQSSVEYGNKPMTKTQSKSSRRACPLKNYPQELKK
jgi:hypothetical protein